MAGTRAPGPEKGRPAHHICPARTPGSLGINDQGDPPVIALQGDTPGPAGIGDYHPPRFIRLASDKTSVAVTIPPVAAGATHDTGASGTTFIVGTGVASTARIPVPGTKLFVELSPRGWVPKGGSTSALFIQDATGKKVLRLDYGYNKTTGAVDYHWNQKGTFAEFGITDHASAGASGEVLFKGAKFLKYGGRALLVVGIAMDAYSIVVAKKRMRAVVRVAAGWAGAEGGAVVLGEWGAGIGTAIEPGGGTAVGAFVFGVIGGAGGYFGASWAAEKTYDWVEDTFFEPVPLTARP
jgi:hypothetical protein